MSGRLSLPLCVIGTVLACALIGTRPSAAQDPCKLDDPPPPPECYSVSVTPKGAVTAVRVANTEEYSEDFTVQNTGNADTYRISCQGTGNVTCTRTSASSVTDFSATVSAFYTVGASGNGTLTLTATGSNASDAGWYSVPIQSFSVSVTPDGGTQPTRTPNTGGYTATFTVPNTGSGSDSYSFGCTGSSNGT